MNKLTLESILECAADLRKSIKEDCERRKALGLTTKYCPPPRQNDYEAGRNVPNDALNPDVKFRPRSII